MRKSQTLKSKFKAGEPDGSNRSRVSNTSRVSERRMKNTVWKLKKIKMKLMNLTDRKFKYNLYLLTYTIKIVKNLKNLGL